MKGREGAGNNVGKRQPFLFIYLVSVGKVEVRVVDGVCTERDAGITF